MNKTNGHAHNPDALLSALGRAGHIIETRMDTALEAKGLSIAKLGVLRVLVQAGEPLPLGQLAERLACVKSNITQLVDRLEADGLVRRMPDHDDRRSLRAAITPDGQRRYELGKQAEAMVERELLADFSPEEQALLATMLNKFGMTH